MFDAGLGPVWSGRVSSKLLISVIMGWVWLGHGKMDQWPCSIHTVDSVYSAVVMTNLLPECIWWM